MALGIVTLGVGRMVVIILCEISLILRINMTILFVLRLSVMNH